MTETSERRFPLPLFLQLQWRASGAVRSLEVPFQKRFAEERRTCEINVPQKSHNRNTNAPLLTADILVIA